MASFHSVYKCSRLSNQFLRNGVLIRTSRGATQKRHFASTEINDKLPLSGLRVLDMTRVLAGVSALVKAVG
jgi:hypothetical protein